MSQPYIDRPATFTDYYELTMAQGYYRSDMHRMEATFDYFFRSLPFESGYVIFAGLNDLLETLLTFRFHDDEISYLNEQGFDREFTSWLKTVRFTGTIHSAREGDIVFPSEPVLRVDAPLVEAQLIETLVLNILNFQSLIATKASRLRHAAGNKKVMDFGLRRAQGLGGIHATRAARIGGVDSTSNVYSAMRYKIPASGTMAHSWVQAFPDELSAFRAYAETFPDQCILLVDTYDTLSSGLPNAIKVAKELEQKGHRLRGIRIDSGDLAYFSGRTRAMLDRAGFQDVRIIASNQIDEHIITSLESQNAPIDIYGVGTRLATAQDSPALDGVFKLAQLNGTETLKVSENVEKVTLPGKKSAFRFMDEDDTFRADAIASETEDEIDTIHHPLFPAQKTRLSGTPFEPIHDMVMNNGVLTRPLPSVEEIAGFCRTRYSKLKTEHKRFENPHTYKVGITTKLMTKRDELIHKIKEETES